MGVKLLMLLDGVGNLAVLNPWLLLVVFELLTVVGM
jgi:hypothetical protein